MTAFEKEIAVNEMFQQLYATSWAEIPAKPFCAARWLCRATC
jgi:hypothetical protein